ncbi:MULTISPECIES: hypothetical protein [Aerococcus]|uniref:Uncharacterized protein n=1 Tax=Aerococcus tenax TaxID=3078812 RepID=A0A5N1BCR3_9LACT|nr:MULTISPECIES: hypothetical protein [Aerococcus]KAA9237838.1 hypothetical protein F6I34_09250 [Aerococcus urinae]MDK6371642.1 hypothetical protein [Aerococcus urinae]MDK6597067.1 hypothetical protein [Aerococcus urinae]MDK7802021.1 hypothetical protein [Aerococcus urinae]MDK8655608.1 hypothetical protein [Aerococcus urinae]
MKYISGVYALNIPCQLNTYGDWHIGALDWSNPKIKESEDSIFKNYGIEIDKSIPEHHEKYPVANHLRAILDMLEDGQTKFLKGFKNDFIGDKYTDEFFDLVYLLKNNKHWNSIYTLMLREYGVDWYAYIYVKEKNHDELKENALTNY